MWQPLAIFLLFPSFSFCSFTTSNFVFPSNHHCPPTNPPKSGVLVAGAIEAEGVVLRLLSKSPLFVFYVALRLIIIPVLPPCAINAPHRLHARPRPFPFCPHATLTEGLIAGGELTPSTLNQTLTWSLWSVCHWNRWRRQVYIYPHTLTHTHILRLCTTDVVFSMRLWHHPAFPTYKDGWHSADRMGVGWGHSIPRAPLKEIRCLEFPWGPCMCACVYNDSASPDVTSAIRMCCPEKPPSH